MSSRCLRSRPIQSSNWAISAICRIHHRLMDRREISKDVHAIGIVPDEKRFPVFFRFVHRAGAAANKYFVKGSRVYLAERPFCQSGPPSAIFCFPTLPQRGIVVGSSVSVAQQCVRSRGRFCRSNPAGGRTSRDRHRVEVKEIAKKLVKPV